MTARSRTRGPMFGRTAAVLVMSLALAALSACSGGGGIKIVAITATPGASGTATPGPIASTATATPRAVPLPPRPENVFAGGVAVAEYLAGGAADIAECLPELVSDWGLAAVEGQRCLSADVDGDGQPEWLFVVALPGDGGSPGPADVWFFEDPREHYRYFNSARGLANDTIAGAQIRLVDDLTGDGAADVVITYETCGATTCVTNLVIASHHFGVLENLAPSDASMESLEDFTIEGAEIRMTGGLITSAGAGPQRRKVVTVAWAGSQFRATEELEAPTHLVHLVNDADAAFAAGDYAKARTAYEAVVRNRDLDASNNTFSAQATRLEMQAYALFREALAAQRQGDGAGMLTLLDRAVQGYEATMHGSAAAVYRESLNNGNTPEVACAAMEAYLGTFASAFNAFWDYGFANPERTTFTICR